MTYLFMDCETIPLITDEIRQDVADSIRVPGSYSKPDTIANWEAQVKPGLVEAELARGGLDATRGRLLSFSYALDDDDPVCIMDEYEKTLLQAAMGVISDCPAYAEDTWTRFKIGEALFRASGPCARCPIPTIDQQTAIRYKEPLTTLAAYRRDPANPGNVCFGQNVIHETKSGRLRVGDAVMPLT